MFPQPTPAKRSPLALRLVVPFLALLAVGAALQLKRIGAAAAGAPPGPPVASNGAHAQVRPDPPERADPVPDDGYRLDDLAVYSAVLNKVAENYVDPRRIDPKAMLLAALDQVERTVAEVMVEGDPATDRIKVTVGQASREFDISGLTTIYSPRLVMGDIMAFVQKHLVAHKNLREIEYAAVNGMLSTLDPHSVLLEPRLFREMRLTTRGEFGGLGFVIAMRDGNLTVVKVLKNTPAQRAGIRAKDVILKIEEQSTVNMDLQDAVDRLRGKPGTRIDQMREPFDLVEPPHRQELAVLALGALPFCALGLAIGYLAGPNSAPSIVNLVFFPFSILSGLWLPVEFLPPFFQKAAPLLPPYHLGRLALGVIGTSETGSAATHVAALMVSTAVFLALAAYGYRRDEGTTYG